VFGPKPDAPGLQSGSRQRAVPDLPCTRRPHPQALLFPIYALFRMAGPEGSEAIHSVLQRLGLVDEAGNDAGGRSGGYLAAVTLAGVSAAAPLVLAVALRKAVRKAWRC
jgi:hypothetical protein